MAVLLVKKENSLSKGENNKISFHIYMFNLKYNKVKKNVEVWVRRFRYHSAHPKTLTTQIRVGESHFIVTVPSTSLSQ